MADLFELIERVQVTLSSSHVPEKNQLLSLHQELDSEIRNANKRLRECDALLASGHRSEAIQMAEHEPPLLDVVSILDFPELPEWNDYVAELGLTVAPDLLVDIAGDLNLAYAEDAPLERHLRRLRLYSLARVPLRTRIDLLRKIAKIDAANSVWQSDLRSYEEERLRQIKEEFRDADQKKDQKKLQELVDELSGKWIIKPRKQFVERIRQSIKGLESVHAVDQLQKVADDLHAAREEGDLEKAVQLSQRWKALSKNCDENSEVYQKLCLSTLQTLRWAQQQQTMKSDEAEFSKKVDLLRRAIKTGMDIEELRRRYVAATRFSNSELPDEIQQDYEDAIFRLEKRRKTRLMIAVAGAAVLLIVIGIVVGIVMLKSKPQDKQTNNAGSGTESYVRLEQSNANRFQHESWRPNLNVSRSTTFVDRMIFYGR